MENSERPENPNKDNVDEAEATLRAIERGEGNSQPGVNAEQNIPVDSFQKLPNNGNEQSLSTLLDHVKEAAVISATGAIIIGGTLLAGHEIAENHPKIDVPNQDINQTQVIESPTSSEQQFVESNQLYTLDNNPVEATSSIKQDAPTQTRYWHNVPEYSQRDLIYKGTNTEYGCVPSSASMVLDFWNQKDASFPTVSAQELLDINTEQGEFNRYGMSSSNLHDELQKIGYTAQDHANSNLDELKTAVAEGPVIAIVKLNMKIDGYNHSVVVTGISDNNEVRVNDPWTGKSETYTWDQFSLSWGANFGTNAPKNSFTSIKPKSM